MSAAAKAVRCRSSCTHAARTRFGVSKGLQAGSSCWVNLESALALQRGLKVLQPHHWFQAGISEYPQAGSLLPAWTGGPAGMASISQCAAGMAVIEAEETEQKAQMQYADLDALAYSPVCIVQAYPC